MNRVRSALKIVFARLPPDEKETIERDKSVFAVLAKIQLCFCCGVVVFVRAVKRKRAVVVGSKQAGEAEGEAV